MNLDPLLHSREQLETIEGFNVDIFYVPRPASSLPHIL